MLYTSEHQALMQSIRRFIASEIDPFVVWNSFGTEIP